MARMTEQISGVDEIIDRLGALPHQVDAGLRRSARQASAAGYRRGLRVLAAQGLDRGTVIGYSRWFAAVQPGGAVHLWLGQNPLRRAGDFEDQASGRRQRAALEFPAGAQKAIQDEVVPEILKVYEGVAEREILKAVASG